MGEENSGAFKCVKISLIVLYVISIIAVVIFIAIAIFGLAILGSNDPNHKLTPEEKDGARILLTTAIIIFAFSLVFAIIGLIGVIKENKCIVITITVFSAIGVVGHFIEGDIGSAIVSLAITVLLGIYAHMIVEKKRKNLV